MVMSTGKYSGYKTKVRGMINAREGKALRRKVDEKEHLRTYGGLRGRIGMKTYLHGPMDPAKNSKVRFSLGRPGRARNKQVVRRRT